MKTMKNKYRKSNYLHCDAGSQRSMSLAVWSLVGFIILVHLYSVFHQRNQIRGQSRAHSDFLSINREIEKIEDETFQFPQPQNKRQGRWVKQRVRRRSIIDEFLDKTSKTRPFFFPDKATAINPLKSSANESMYFYPGRIWLDTDGNPIQAHGGGVLYDENSGMYYWYEKIKMVLPIMHTKEALHGLVSIICCTARVDIIGVSCYSSKDLWAWKHEGIVLRANEHDISHDLYKNNVLERPKVVYNRRSNKYVMWMHIDNVNYTKASVGVAISDSPMGPFKYLYSTRPHGFASRDMMIFKDDDDKAYIIYSSEDNSVLHVGPLNVDYLHVTWVMRRILIGQHREAPALFKHQGTYYMITSGCSGWAPNEPLAHGADSIMGPWETLGNPCIGGNQIFQATTFFSQSTFVLPLPGMPGSFIFMADRWNPADLKDSRYVWLPLTIGGAVDEPLEYSFGFPLWSRVSIYWHKRWKLPDEWKGVFWMRPVQHHKHDRICTHHIQNARMRVQFGVHALGVSESGS